MNFSQVSVWDMKNLIDKMKNVVYNYSDIEIKINQATNSEKWGASRTLMLEISGFTFQREQAQQVVDFLFTKFNFEPSKWRQIYKALQLLEYIIKNGSDICVDLIQQKQSALRQLGSFQFLEENETDRGVNVRVLSKQIVDLLANNPLLQEERKKAIENRNKYKGVGSESLSSGFGSGIGSNTSNSNGGSGGGSRSSGGYNIKGSIPKTNARTTSYEHTSSDTNRFETHTASSKISSIHRNAYNNGKQPERYEPETEPQSTGTSPVDDLLLFDDTANSNSNTSTNPSVYKSPQKNIKNTLLDEDPWESLGNSKSKTEDTTGCVQKNNDEDDWGDFQSIPITAATTNTHGNVNANVNSNTNIDTGLGVGVNVGVDVGTRNTSKSATVGRSLLDDDGHQLASESNNLWVKHKSLISLDDMFPTTK